MISRSAIAIIIGAVAVAAIGASGAFLMLSVEEEKTFTLTYYKDGDRVFYESVAAGTPVVVIGSTLESRDGERFVGWNTEADMSGRTLATGSQLIIDRDISLHAVILGEGVYLIILPDDQRGFSVTAEPQMVRKGGSSTVSYSLLPSHTDDELVISVNGNPMKLDAMNRIRLTDISEDKTVTVSGVHDKREHDITVPEDQVGYELTSSAGRVHHGESYSLAYRLLPGYTESDVFGIHINGGDPRIPSEGEMLILDVRDNHIITVTGIEPISYNISSGKNISVMVNGTVDHKATVEDLVTVLPAEGYKMPDTFDSGIAGAFEGEGGTYRITGDIVFPSVLKITAGENVRIDGSSAAVFVCPYDRLTVSAAPGYSLPDDYSDRLDDLDGVSGYAKEFSFTEDTALLSVYKVTFNGYNKVHETFFVVDGTLLPIPLDDPQRNVYCFERWYANLSIYVHNNISIDPVWSPMKYSVFFGPNLIVEIGNKHYMFVEGDINNLPRSITINSDEKVFIYNVFDLDLPNSFGPRSGNANYVNGYYEIIENCSFPGITYVKYWESDAGDGPIHSVVIGDGYIPLSGPTHVREGYTFVGWTLNGIIQSSQIAIENKIYVLSTKWRDADG